MVKLKIETMTKPKIKIDVVSDVVCPWCYIGKRRLEKAIAQVSDQLDVELAYHIRNDIYFYFWLGHGFNF